MKSAWIVKYLASDAVWRQEDKYAVQQYISDIRLVQWIKYTVGLPVYTGNEIICSLSLMLIIVYCIALSHQVFITD